MNYDSFQEAWKTQSVPLSSADSLGDTIRSRATSEKRKLTASGIIAIAALGIGIFNFYGQFFLNGNDLLVSLLRALPVLVAIPIHFAVQARLVKNHRERTALAEDHRQWLNRWTDELKREADGQGRWKLVAFSTFVCLIVALTKWMDYRSGVDSLAECIGITTLVAVLFCAVGIAIWHYRTQFLIPEHRRYCRIRDELEQDSDRMSHEDASSPN